MSASGALRIGVAGAGGRMGRTLIAAIHSDPALELGAAFEHSDSEFLGADAGSLAGVAQLGIGITHDLARSAGLGAYDCLIDFSTPAATLAAIEVSVAHKLPLVIGTTGFSVSELQHIQEAAGQVPLFMSPNMSIGVNLAFKLIGIAAQVLADEVDVEIIEAHHRDKVDAPSGTAVRMGEIVAAKTGRVLARDALYGRHGQVGARKPGTIGFASIRAGDIVGEHTVLFAGEGERLEITHRASSRMNFARGALRAAHWLVDRPPGLYGMDEVLGF